MPHVTNEQTNQLTDAIKSHFQYVLYRYDETKFDQDVIEYYDTFEEALRDMFFQCKVMIGEGECDYFDTPEDLAGTEEDGFGNDQHILIAQYKEQNGSLRWAHWGFEVARISRQDTNMSSKSTSNSRKQYSSIKFPRRKQQLHGVDIVAVDFGMPFYSFFYANKQTIEAYVETFQARKRNLEQQKKIVSKWNSVLNCYENVEQNKIDYQQCWKNDQQYGTTLTKLRKQIRLDKWEALKDEVLVVVHSKGWMFDYDGHRPPWRSYPGQGSILMPAGSNDDDSIRYYMYTSEETDTNYTIKFKRGRAVIDSVVPLNETFVGE